MSYRYKYVKAWRARSKARLVKAFGKKCISCGYSKCIEALEFHHKNPDEKDFTISSYQYLNWNRLVQEAKKCILVCCRCHREIHDGLIDISTLKQNIDEQVLNYKEDLVETKIPCICGVLKPLKNKYCSPKCANSNKPSKAKWDSINLAQCLKQLDYEAIGRLVGVSGTAVKKRAKKLGLR